MNNQEAIQAIKNNWPDERYAILREALTLAIDELDKTSLSTSKTIPQAIESDNICDYCADADKPHCPQIPDSSNDCFSGKKVRAL